MVLGFLAVEAEGQVAAPRCAGYCHGRGQRDALVGRPEQHIELRYGFFHLQQPVGVETGQAAQPFAVVEEPRIEEVRRQPPRLRLELAEAQRSGVERELDKLVGKIFHHRCLHVASRIPES